MSTTKKLNRGLALALILALILCLLPVAAHAYSGGQGTQASPYLISSTTDLDSLRTAVNGGNAQSGVYFKLTNNISTVSTTIGNSSNPFSGNFDGDGYSIALNISTSSTYQGLFAYLSGATIQNLSVSGTVNCSGKSRIGGIAGYATNDSTITGCSNSATVSGSSYVGGIVGYLNGGSVINCSNQGTITGSSDQNGGVVGYTGGTCLIDGCYNKGTVSGASRIGGVVGEQYSSVTVSNCYNKGGVTGSTSAAGGVVGYSRAAVSNCYHAVGTISGSGTKGAIIGHMYSSGSITNCYYEVVQGLNGVGNTTGGTGLSDVQMQAAASSLGNYYEADSNNINGGYPILYWQGSGSTPSTGIVSELNSLIGTNGSSITVKYADMTDYYSNGDTIYEDSVYLTNFTIASHQFDNNTTGTVSTVWTSSSVAVSVPNDGNGLADVTHSTSEALSVTLTAYLRTEIGGVTYTSTDYVRYTFTISRDYGDPVVYTVYVSVFQKMLSNNNYNPIIEEDDQLIVAVPVTVSGYEYSICVDDALRQLHENFDIGDDYVVSSSGMITKLWGFTNTNNAFGIYRNDTLTNAVTVEPIAEGDLVTAFVYTNTSSYSDRYLFFANTVTLLASGDDTTLPVSYRTYSSSTGTTVSDPTVTVYKLDEETGELATTSEVTYTPASKKLEADDNVQGTYILLAKHARVGNWLTGYTYYVPGVAMVKVDLSDEDAVAADKAALALVTGANNTVISYVDLPASGANGCDITWEISPSGVIDEYGQVTRPSTDTVVTLEATISKGEEEDYKTFYVTVPAAVATYSSILPSLTTALVPSSANVTSSNIEDYLWYIMDIIAYEKATTSVGTYITTSEKADYYSYIIGFVEDVISSSDTNAQKSSDLAKAIIVLKALNYDNSGSNSGYSVNNISWTVNNETVKLMDYLETYTTAAISEAQAAQDDPDAVLNYLPTASFVLMAGLEETSYLDTSFRNTLRSLLLNNQIKTGDDAGSWSVYTDIDAVILAGLGFYKQVFTTDSDVQTAIDDSADYLSGLQLPNGSFSAVADGSVGNVNTTAFVLIGLAAAGKNAEGTTFTENGHTVVDGVMNYYNASTGLFQYAGLDNAMATEQAYRALVAWYGFAVVNNSSPFAVYRFAYT